MKKSTIVKVSAVHVGDTVLMEGGSGRVHAITRHPNGEISLHLQDENHNDPVIRVTGDTEIDLLERGIW